MTNHSSPATHRLFENVLSGRLPNAVDMQRLRNWLQQRQEDRLPLVALRRFQGDTVDGHVVARVLWDGPSAAVLHSNDGSLIKVWLDGARHVEDNDWLQTRIGEHVADAPPLLPVAAHRRCEDDVVAVQPGVRYVLPNDPMLRSFRPDDMDNRLELGEKILRLLASVEAAGHPVGYFTPWQIATDADGALRFDRLGAPYPPPHMHRLLTHRHHLDEMHLRPRPCPPEVLSGHPTPATAVWCAGHLLFELLTGRAPFGGADDTLSSMAMLLDGPPSASTANPRVSAGLSRLISRMLVGTPGRRPATLAACVADYVAT